MPTIRVPVACLLGAALAVAQPVFRFADDFGGHPEGSGGEPAWEVNDIGFAVRGGGLAAEVLGQRGVARPAAAPLATALVLEARLTPVRPLGGQWKTAGLAVMLDEHNYWQLALAESPDGRRRFVELAEMLDGVWLAHAAPATRVATAEDSGPFEWRHGVGYRLRLALERGAGPPRLTGEVFEGETRRYRCVRVLDGRAVDRGRPALVANSLAAAFDDVAVEVTAAAAEPPVPAAAAPPFRSTPLTAGPARQASGFFRVEEEAGTWWLVDPAGQRTLSLGTDHVSHTSHWCEALGHAPYQRVVERKFPTAEAWAEDAVRRLREWNFTTLGAGCSPQAFHRGLAHMLPLGFGTAFASVAALVEKTTWTGFPDVFDPRFERFCELRARQLCTPNRDDPWLVGYFLDNELEWWGKSYRPWGIAEDTARLPATAAGKTALVASLRRSFADDPAALNHAFNSSFPGFDALLPPFDLPQPHTDVARAALDAFIDEAAKRYFLTTTAAIRRHDPNHLTLGCRFAHDAPPPAWRHAGATCQIVSVNAYPRADLHRNQVPGLADHLAARHRLCGRPLVLTEWGFPSLDAVDSAGRPLPCTHGAGMRVDTVAQKARCYVLMQRELCALPFVVGSHYFMWCDEPALGISAAFPENSSYGLNRESDEPYQPLVETAARVNARMPALHAGALRTEDVDPGPPEAAAGAAAPQPAGSRVTFDQSAAGAVVETSVLRAMRGPGGGAAFDRIDWRAAPSGPWLELGSYATILHTVAAGSPAWPHPDQAPGFTMVEQSPQRLVLDVEGRRAADPAYRVCTRLTFAAGQPWFEARCRWVENSGPAPWTLGGYLHYPLSRLGGDPSDDAVGGPGVPNYWLKVASWRDPALGLHYGAWVRGNDPRLDCSFWRDVVQHPDCERKLGLELTPGQRWTADADEPAVAVFGLQETAGAPRPWRDVVASLEAQPHPPDPGAPPRPGT